MVKKIIIKTLFSFLLMSSFNNFLTSTDEKKPSKWTESVPGKEIDQNSPSDQSDDDEYKDFSDDSSEEDYIGSILNSMPTTTASEGQLTTTTRHQVIPPTPQTPHRLPVQTKTTTKNKNAQAKITIQYIKKDRPSAQNSSADNATIENRTKQYAIPSRFYIPDIPHQSINNDAKNPSSLAHFSEMKKDAYLQIKNTQDNSVYVPAQKWLGQNTNTDLGTFIQQSKSDIYASTGDNTLSKIQHKNTNTRTNSDYWSRFKYAILNPKGSVSNSWSAIKNYFSGIWGLTKVYGG